MNVLPWMLAACMCIATSSLFAQDIEAKLGGNTDSYGFTVKNNAGTGLFTVRGNGRIGMGTSLPDGLLHMEGFTGSVNGIRMLCNTTSGWSALYAKQDGLGPVATLTINNSASGQHCLSATSNGPGTVIVANNAHASGTILQLINGVTTRFQVESNGIVHLPYRLGIGTTSPAAQLSIENTSGNGVKIDASSSSSSIWVSQSGTGNAARFDITNSTSTNNCLDASTNATAPAIYASSSNIGGRILQANNGSSTVRFFVESGGNVGIGVDDATQDLDVLGNARFRGVTATSYSAPLNLTSTGILTTSTSDIRMKTNITSLGDALGAVLRLRPVRFHWKSDPDGTERIGFIAQEVREVVPEVVFTNPVDGYLGLNYAELTALLAAAMQEQHRMIQALDARTAEAASLRSRVMQLENTAARVHALETELDALKAVVEERLAAPRPAQASLRSDR